VILSSLKHERATRRCTKNYASTDQLQQTVGFKPETSIEEGLQKFTDWYVDYYKVK